MIAYNEWKHKSSKATKLLRRIQKEIHSIAPGAEVILYGSRVRGESEKASDWDYPDKETGDEYVSECAELGATKLIPDGPLPPGDIFSIGYNPTGIIILESGWLSSASRW